MKILLLGSSGYVGEKLNLHLKNNYNFKILTLNRVDSSNPFLFELNDGITVIHGDLRDPNFLNDSLNVDVVVNAIGDVTKSHEPQSIESLVNANSLIPALVASHFSGSAIKFIQLGTFSHKSDLSNYHPQTFYAATKYAGEQFLRYFSINGKLTIIVFHTYDIYGENQPHNRLLKYLISSIQNREQILISRGEQELTPIYISDLVENICAAIIQNFDHESKYIEFDAYGPETFLVKDLPWIISECMGVELPNPQVSMSLPYSGKEIFKFNPCHRSLISLNKLTPLSEGIKRIMRDENKT